MSELNRYYACEGRVYERIVDHHDLRIVTANTIDRAWQIALALNVLERKPATDQHIVDITAESKLLRAALIGAVESGCLEQCGVVGLTCKTPCTEFRVAYELVGPKPKEATSDA